jgi:hypothetical protein
MIWQPIETLTPEHGEVMIWAPDEEPQFVSGSLVTVDSDGIEFYVRYTEELLHDAIGEIINPTFWAEKPSPPAIKAKGVEG